MKKRVPAIMDPFPALFNEGIDRNEFNNMIKAFNQLLDRFWDNRNLDSKFFMDNQVFQKDNKFPKINLTDQGDSFKIEIAVAGFDKDDIELEFKDNGLYIKAEQKEDNGSGGDNYVVQEIAKRSFRRFIPLPEKVDKESLTSENASYENGIITCVFPKKSKEVEDQSVKLTIN